MSFVDKFQQIASQMMKEEATRSLQIDIDEICLAIESSPYMHMASDGEDVLDTMII